MKQVAATANARTSAHVLLVDDDVSLLKLLGMRLESRGYRVTTAESGREALKRLEEGRPDLVLSDLRFFFQENYF